jgi:cytochrome c
MPAFSATGEQLLKTHRCQACHKAAAKSIGPSYQDIAAKNSEATKANLAKAIKAGSKGVWGKTAMPANPKISDKDVNDMVEYILTVK